MEVKNNENQFWCGSGLPLRWCPEEMLAIYEYMKKVVEE